MATARRTTRSSPTQQQGPGAQRLVERELAEVWAFLDQADPAADKSGSSRAKGRLGVLL